MKRIVAWVLAGSWIVSAGCGGSHPPARPKRPGAATRPASVPATRPAETQPAATKPTTPQVAKDFDTELAKVRALVERTELHAELDAGDVGGRATWRPWPGG